MPLIKKRARTSDPHAFHLLHFGDALLQVADELVAVVLVGRVEGHQDFVVQAADEPDAVRVICRGKPKRVGEKKTWASNINQVHEWRATTKAARGCRGNNSSNERTA